MSMLAVWDSQAGGRCGAPLVLVVARLPTGQRIRRLRVSDKYVIS
jgi:hypothetical protein